MTYESSAVRDARIDVAAVLGAVVRRLPRIVLVTLVLLAVTFAALMFVPRLYESSASILVEARSNVYSRAANEQVPTLTGGEAGVVSSQIELIKSRDTLLKVIDQLDLRSVPEFNGMGGGSFSPLAVVGQLLISPTQSPMPMLPGVRSFHFPIPPKPQVGCATKSSVSALWSRMRKQRLPISRSTMICSRAATIPACSTSSFPPYPPRSALRRNARIPLSPEPT